jgi:hypothetical protein
MPDSIIESGWTEQTAQARYFREKAALLLQRGVILWQQARLQRLEVAMRAEEARLLLEWSQRLRASDAISKTTI